MIAALSGRWILRESLGKSRRRRRHDGAVGKDLVDQCARTLEDRLEPGHPRLRLSQWPDPGAQGHLRPRDEEIARSRLPRRPVELGGRIYLRYRSEPHV